MHMFLFMCMFMFRFIHVNVHMTQIHIWILKPKHTHTIIVLYNSSSNINFLISLTLVASLSFFARVFGKPGFMFMPGDDLKLVHATKVVFSVYYLLSLLFYQSFQILKRSILHGAALEFIYFSLSEILVCTMVGFTAAPGFIRETGFPARQWLIPFYLLSMHFF